MGDACNPAEARLSRLLLLFFIGIASIVSLYAAPPDDPAFDVASIRRDVGNGPIYLAWFPTFRAQRQTLKALVGLAYQVRDFQLTGGPAWIDSDRFDIDAKTEERLAPGQQHVDLQRRRLRTLLHDRFHLTLHPETKSLPIYELVVAKGGPRMQPSTCIDRETGDTAIAPGRTAADYCLGSRIGRGGMESRGSTMAFLASSLSSQLSRMVVDKTGLAGKYKIHLTYTPDALAVPAPDAADGSAPDIFAAIQEQLGLKLESAKAPVEVLVIDYVERPSEN